MEVVNESTTASTTKISIDSARKIEGVDVSKSGVKETADTISTKETTTTEEVGNEVNAVSKEQLNKANLDVVNEPAVRITKASVDNVCEIASVDVLKSREKEVADLACQLDIIQSCCICMTGKKQVLFQPCLCICVCNECCVKCKECPMCRKVVKRRTKNVNIMS